MIVPPGIEALVWVAAGCLFLGGLCCLWATFTRACRYSQWSHEGPVCTNQCWLSFYLPSYMLWNALITFVYLAPIVGSLHNIEFLTMTQSYPLIMWLITLLISTVSIGLCAFVVVFYSYRLDRVLGQGNQPPDIEERSIQRAGINSHLNKIGILKFLMFVSIVISIVAFNMLLSLKEWELSLVPLYPILCTADVLLTVMLFAMGGRFILRRGRRSVINEYELYERR